MNIKGYKNHPYIPNSVPEVQKRMLDDIGLSSLEQLHAEIPDEIKLKENMKLPKALGSEYEVKRHVEKMLNKNIDCKENVSFLGGGCWQHYVPAVCDEINQRGEFLTAYGGESYNDFGRFQALFEYQSLLGELLDMDVVNVPTMDWPQSAATAIQMAHRITDRKKVLVPSTLEREKYQIIKNYTTPLLDLVSIDYDHSTGGIDLIDLRSKLDEEVAAVYIEVPSYIGFIEENRAIISELSHEIGALFIVGVDPSSLGIIEPPSAYGADIVCGDLQPLGIHMHYGGGQSGFIASRDEEKFVMEYPSRIFGMAPTIKDGEYAFGDVAYDRTSFGHHREHGKEYVGTQTALWGITAGVYLSVMGPKGMEELGQTIIQNRAYLQKRMNQINGVNAEKFRNINFKEFVVDFSETGKTVKEINASLLDKNIFGGKDLSEEYPHWGQCALYCVTEIHLKEDLEQLIDAMEDIFK